MGTEAFDDGTPDWCGHGGLDAHHAVGIDATGIATAKQLCMLNGAAHAHSAHKLIHRFRKWSAQEAHAWGMAKRCDATAGTDDNAVTPWQVTENACPVQAVEDFVRLLVVFGQGLDDDIDACLCFPKAIEYLLDSGHSLIVKCIINSEYHAIDCTGIIRLQIDWAGEYGARKLGIGDDGILQVPKQKLKIGVIGNTDICNGLQRFWYIPARGCLHAASFPARFRLGYTVWWCLAALS